MKKQITEKLCMGPMNDLTNSKYPEISNRKSQINEEFCKDTEYTI